MRQQVIRKRPKSMRWLISWLSILLSLLLVTHCQKSSRVTERSAEVALYSDQGTDDNCIKATTNMFEWMGYTVQLVKADYINNKGLEGFSILCVPGGNMYQYAQDISLAGKEEIRRFIRDGGGYIGICGGAYFTGEKVIWQGNQLPMTPLGLFQGATKGPIDAIAPYPHCAMCKVNILDSTHPITQSESDSAWILYCYGPMFIPNNEANVSILGQYDIGDYPMMMAFDYGQGRVFIIGTHPEFEEDSDRDGLPPNDAFDDQGSDWELMKKAVLWCLKK